MFWCCPRKYQNVLNQSLNLNFKVRWGCNDSCQTQNYEVNCLELKTNLTNNFKILTSPSCSQAVLVHTQETIRVRYFMDLLMENRRPIMLVGSAGTGKTVLVGDKFAAMDPDNVIVTNVPFNYYTTSAMLQAVLDKPLEKKAGRNYGPPGTKKLIYFIDDMNMPMVRALNVLNESCVTGAISGRDQISFEINCVFVSV